MDYTHDIYDVSTIMLSLRRCQEKLSLPLVFVVFASAIFTIAPYSHSQSASGPSRGKGGDELPQAEGRWREFVSERYHEVEVEGTVGSKSVDFTHRHSKLSPVVSWGREVLDIENKMGSALEKALRSAFDGVTVRNWSFSTTGSPTISLSMSQGVLSVTLGGVSIRASAKLRYNSWISGKIRIVTSTVWLTGTYDAITGIAKLSLPEDFTIDVNASPNFKFPLNIILPAAVPLCVAYFEAKTELSKSKSAKLCLAVATEGALPISLGLLNDEFERLLNQSISSVTAADYMFYGLEDAFASVELTPSEIANLSQEVRDFLTIANGRSVSLSVIETYQNLGMDSGRRSCGRNLEWSYTNPVVVSIVNVELSFPSVTLTVRNGVDTDYVWECDGKCVQGGVTVPAECPVTPKPNT